MKASLTSLPPNITGIWGIHWGIYGKEGREENNPTPFSSWKVNHEKLSNSVGSTEHQLNPVQPVTPSLGSLSPNSLPISTLQTLPAS